MSLKKVIGASSLAVLLGACVGPAPVEDYNLAKTAMAAAKTHGAESYTPGLWYKADQAYSLGVKAFEAREYEDAKRLFKQSQAAAEKAENASRLKKFLSGEGP